MPDYMKLLDAETWAFIERTNAYYPPETIDFTIDQQRAVYDRMCQAFHAGYPETVTAETTKIDFHENASSSAPEINSPRVAPLIANAAQMATALARLSAG